MFAHPILLVEAAANLRSLLPADRVRTAPDRAELGDRGVRNANPEARLARALRSRNTFAIAMKLRSIKARILTLSGSLEPRGSFDLESDVLIDGLSAAIVGLGILCDFGDGQLWTFGSHPRKCIIAHAGRSPCIDSLLAVTNSMQQTACLFVRLCPCRNVKVLSKRACRRDRAEYQRSFLVAAAQTRAQEQSSFRFDL